MYKHILITTDGSEFAQKGLEHGLALAKALGAKVTIVTVIERFPIYAGFDGGMSAVALTEYAAGQKEGATKVLATAKDAAGRAGVGAETQVIDDGVPADGILEAAKTGGCDLVVMSSHGRRGLSRLVLGSVSSEVVNRSPIPVLVVR